MLVYLCLWLDLIWGLLIGGVVLKCHRHASMCRVDTQRVSKPLNQCADTHKVKLICGGADGRDGYGCVVKVINMVHQLQQQTYTVVQHSSRKCVIPKGSFLNPAG